MTAAAILLMALERGPQTSRVLRTIMERTGYEPTGCVPLLRRLRERGLVVFVPRPGQRNLYVRVSDAPPRLDRATVVLALLDDGPATTRAIAAALSRHGYAGTPKQASAMMQRLRRRRLVESFRRGWWQREVAP